MSLMTWHKKSGALATILLMVLSCSLPAQQKPVEARSMDVAVIVNPMNSLDSISAADLRKIFSGEKVSWGNGLAISVFVRAPQSHERDILLSRVLHMSESEYKAHWVQKVYSGEAQREPLSLLSNGMQLEAVRAERGGIALISMQDLHQGVKVLKVDGKLPGAAGYSLK